MKLRSKAYSMSNGELFILEERDIIDVVRRLKRNCGNDKERRMLYTAMEQACLDGLAPNEGEICKACWSKPR